MHARLHQLRRIALTLGLLIGTLLAGGASANWR